MQIPNYTIREIIFHHINADLFITVEKLSKIYLDSFWIIKFPWQLFECVDKISKEDLFQSVESLMNDWITYYQLECKNILTFGRILIKI